MPVESQPPVEQALPDRQNSPANTRAKKVPPPRPTHCLNCGAAATGKFCAECGQENEDQTVAVKLLVGDLLSDLASFDSKLLRTLVPLIFRPGFLTNKYNAGKRVRYLSPLKLYLTFSVLFFLALPLTHHGSLINLDTAPAKTAAALKEANKADPELKSDLKEAQADLADDQNSKPLHTTLTLGRSSYDLTHLPATVGEYDAQQRDPHRRPDPKIVQYLLRQVIKVKQSPQTLSAALLDDIPKMMFVLLPAFALSLKLVYLRSKRLYIEHLIFSLHLHAFLFLLLTILLLAQAVPNHAPLTSFLVLAAFVYPYAAMRVVYTQGWGKTFVKYTLLAGNYLVLLAFALLGALAVAFLFV